jgi:ribonuclease HI
MTAWHVWTDGSCMHGLRESPPGVGGWGGWAAILERDADGLVLRGRVPDTTSVRMELVAAIEGLRRVPDGATAVLHTDCTTLLNVYDRWQRGILRGYHGKDARLWLELEAEYDRVPTTPVLIVKGDVDLIHRRAHAIAGSEARAALRGLTPDAVVLEDARRLVQLNRSAAASAAARAQARAPGTSELRDRAEAQFRRLFDGSGRVA